MPYAMAQKVTEGQLSDKDDEDEDEEALSAFDSVIRTMRLKMAFKGRRRLKHH